MAPQALPAVLAASHGWVYIVSDGMGGYAGGETASRLVVESFGRAYYECGAAAVPERILFALTRAHRAVQDEKVRQPQLAEMGATIVALIVLGRQAWMVNIGDSRGYLIRARQVRRLTEDHSMLAEGVRSGILTEQEAQQSPLKGVLTRAIGGAGDLPSAAVTAMTLEPGNRIVLCTDGVWGTVSDRGIGDVVGRARIGDAATALLTAAKTSDDNISAIVVEVPRRLVGRPWWIAMVGLTLLVLIGALAWWIGNGGASTPAVVAASPKAGVRPTKVVTAAMATVWLSPGVDKVAAVATSFSGILTGPVPSRTPISFVIAPLTVTVLSSEAKGVEPTPTIVPGPPTVWVRPNSEQCGSLPDKAAPLSSRSTVSVTICWSWGTRVFQAGDRIELTINYESRRYANRAEVCGQTWRNPCIVLEFPDICEFGLSGNDQLCISSSSDIIDEHSGRLQRPSKAKYLRAGNYQVVVTLKRDDKEVAVNTLDFSVE